MNNLYKKFSFFFNLTFVVISLISLTLVVIFSQQRQNTQSKAATQAEYSAFEVTDSTGNQLPFTDNNSLRTYDTNSLDVTIKIIDLEKLNQ